MYEVDPRFAPEKLVKGLVYRFKARNFSYGVWDGKSGFIGVRQKFNDIYLFTEYHADLGGQYGTVWNISEHIVGSMVPDGIEVRNRLDFYCEVCDERGLMGAVEFEPDIPFARVPGRQYHADRALDADHDPHGLVYVRQNTPLLLWLAQFEQDEVYRHHITALQTANSDERAALWDALKQHYRDQKGF